MKTSIFIGTTLLLLQLIEINAGTIEVEKIVKSVNDNADLPWKADTYGHKEIDEKILRARLGVKVKFSKSYSHVDPRELLKLAAADPTTTADSDRDRLGLPVNFTWADEKNTKCPIRHIRDQSNCGSCWAVSSVSALGDRICIKSKEKVKEQLSDNFVTACNTNNYGCNGGSMTEVNQFLTTVGTITGGNYESDEGCQMYTVKPCGFTPIHMPCAYDTAITPKCRKRKCNNDWYPFKEEPESKVYKAKSWYMVRSNITHSREDRIRDEIVKNGPVTAAFVVPMDFYFYKKGVYVPGRTYYVGFHAVRVVGYGVEKGVKYWHAVNSWSPSWGEKGFFKILRGVNILYFEAMVSALEPRVEN